MKEADFQTRFGKRLREGRLGFPELFRLYPSSTSGFAFELKLCVSGRALSVSAVADHQLAALEAINLCVSPDGWSGGEGLYIKLTDLSMGSKPFDCLYLEGGIGRLILGWHDKGKRVVRAYSVTPSVWRGLVARARGAGRLRVTEAMVPRSPVIFFWT